MGRQVPEHVLVLISAPDGRLRDADGEALGAARAVAESRGAAVAAALIGNGLGEAAREAAERGADLVLVADSAELATVNGERVAPIAVAAVARAEARVVLAPRGPDLLELAPRVAARAGGASVIGVTAIRPEGDDVSVEAAVFGGAARAVYRFHASGPRVLGLAPAVADAPEREAGRSAETVELSLPDVQPRVEVVQAADAGEGPRLEDAQYVVSGGRGLQDGENYGLIAELAEKIGGMPGASRAIVDDGWATAEQQVGLTGKIVVPDVYFAIGISGASQHMAGCSNARCLVAINNDPEAPIFKYAHYGIVDDALDVLPELIRLTGEQSS